MKAVLGAVLALSFVLSASAGQQNGKPQEGAGIKQQPIRKWKYQRKDPNPRTGQEEITAEMEGEEALPIDLAKGKEVFEVRGIKARYFTDPKRPEDKSEEIEIEADHARMDNGARTLKLNNRVRVTKPDPEKKAPPIVLQTSSALVRFNRQYVCPKCETFAPAPGRCPVHAADFKEKTTTTVETDREFELLKPEGLITGEGLAADDAIRQYQVSRKGFVELAGDPSHLDPKQRRAEPGQPMFTQLFSTGPLQVSEDAAGVSLLAREGIRLDRIEPTGTFTVNARQALIEVARVVDPETARRTLVPRSVDAQGRVRLEGVTFADAMAVEADADRLVWEQETGADYVLDIATLSAAEGARVHIRPGASEITARRVTLDRVSGTAWFEEEVVSRMAVGREVMDLSCGTMTTTSGLLPDGRMGLRTLEARDKVVLGGLLSKPRGAAVPNGPEEPPGRAQADRFYWDLIEERGVLEGRPFVTIVQGQNTIQAPKIALESPDIFVLKGPKRIRLSQVREGKIEEYRVTSQGDIVVDSASGAIRLRDRCELRTQDIRLFSDRVNVVLGKDGKSVESLVATGDVRALRAGIGATVYGDRLQFNPADQSMEIIGHPYTVADAGRTVIIQKKIRLYEKDKIQYRESEGVRIIFDEKTRDEKAPGSNGKPR